MKSPVDLATTADGEEGQSPSAVVSESVGHFPGSWATEFHPQTTLHSLERAPRTVAPLESDRLLPGAWAAVVVCWFLVLGAGLSIARAELIWTNLPPIPNALGVAAPFAGVSGGALLVAGGANFPRGFPWEGGKKVWHDAVYALPNPNGKWQSAGKLPRPLGYGVSATFGGGVVCAGGSDAGRHYAEVFRLKWESRALQTTTLPSLPKPCANAAGALLGDTLFLAGGEETPGATNALHTFWSLELGNPPAGWQELPPWPGPARSLAVAAVQAGSFFVVGGVSLTGGADGRPVRTYLADGYCYDPKRRTWQRIADLPHPVAAAPSPAPAVGQSHFLVLGGDDGSKAGFQPPAAHPGFPRGILAYDTITDTWRPRGEVPLGQVTVPTVPWQGRWVMPSGEIRPGVRTPEVRALDLQGAQGGVWFHQLPHPRALPRRNGLAGRFLHEENQKPERLLPGRPPGFRLLRREHGVGADGARRRQTGGGAQTRFLARTGSALRVRSFAPVSFLSASFLAMVAYPFPADAVGSSVRPRCS